MRVLDEPDRKIMQTVHSDSDAIHIELAKNHAINIRRIDDVSGISKRLMYLTVDEAHEMVDCLQELLNQYHSQNQSRRNK